MMVKWTARKSNGKFAPSLAGKATPLVGLDQLRGRPYRVIHDHPEDLFGGPSPREDHVEFASVADGEQAGIDEGGGF